MTHNVQEEFQNKWTHLLLQLSVETNTVFAVVLLICAHYVPLLSFCLFIFFNQVIKTAVLICRGRDRQLFGDKYATWVLNDVKWRCLLRHL